MISCKYISFLQDFVIIEFGFRVISKVIKAKVVL
jgi:hypothetical protein